MFGLEVKPILIFDRNLRVTAASPASATLLGIPERELVGIRCRDALHCPECTGEACPLRQALHGEAAEGLLPGDFTNGSLIVSTSPISGAREDGFMALLYLRAHDAESVVLGAGLQRVLDGLREMLSSDLAALAFYDETLKEVRWQVTSGSQNPDVTSIRLRPGEGFAGRIVLNDLPLQTFRFPQDLTEDPSSYPIFLAEGLKAAVGVPVRGAAKVLGVLMVASREEREYTDEDLERLTRVADSVSLAAEMMTLHEDALRRERAKLAQEVHDGLSQNLFGLQLLLYDLQQNLYSDSPATVEKGLTDICRVLDGTLGEVRRLITDLRGSTRIRRGLISALTDYLAHFHRLSDLQVELAVRLPVGEEISCGETHEVLRIVQEALMNVHRHAHAGHVRVEVTRQDGGYRVAIEDDGIGFDPDAAVPEGHFGLAIMQERATKCGAQLMVNSREGEGTCVEICIPV